jgi:hypothetical protein
VASCFVIAWAWPTLVESSRVIDFVVVSFQALLFSLSFPGLLSFGFMYNYGTYEFDERLWGVCSSFVRYVTSNSALTADMCTPQNWLMTVIDRRALRLILYLIGWNRIGRHRHRGLDNLAYMRFVPALNAS